MSQLHLTLASGLTLRYGFDRPCCGYFFDILDAEGKLVEGVTIAFACDPKETEMSRGEMVSWLEEKEIWDQLPEKRTYCYDTGSPLLNRTVASVVELKSLLQGYSENNIYDDYI